MSEECAVPTAEEKLLDELLKPSTPKTEREQVLIKHINKLSEFNAVFNAARYRCLKNHCRFVDNPDNPHGMLIVWAIDRPNLGNQHFDLDSAVDHQFCVDARNTDRRSSSEP